MTEPTIFDHLFLAFILGFGLYAVCIGQPKIKQLEPTTANKLSIYWSNGVFLWIAAVATGAVWLLAGRRLTDLGLTLQHDWPLIGIGLALLLVVLMSVDLWFDAGTPARRHVLRERWKRDVPFLPETPREAAHFSIMGVTAGVTEEIIARGFLISYLAWYMPDTLLGVSLAVLIPAIAFALAHLYQDRRAVVRIVIMASIFGAIFVVTGSLLIPIILHAAVDVFAGVLAQKMSREGGMGGHPQLTAG